MMLLSGSKSSPHTCWAIMGRVSTRPTLRRKYSRRAYSRVVSVMRRPSRVTVRVAGSRVRSASLRTGARWPVPRRKSARTRARNSSRSEEHTSELQSRLHLVCRLLLEKKKKKKYSYVKIKKKKEKEQ